MTCDEDEVASTGCPMIKIELSAGAAIECRPTACFRGQLLRQLQPQPLHPEAQEQGKEHHYYRPSQPGQRSKAGRERKFRVSYRSYVEGDARIPTSETASRSRVLDDDLLA